MTSFAPGRSRLLAAVGALAVIAVAACVLVLALKVSLPQAWWPHTGQAFTAGAPSRDDDRCARISGPARKYCERGTVYTASAGHDGATAGLWRLVPVGAGLAALVLWRRRGTGRRQG
ncbi:hypothetical protein ACWCQK_37360 [Streptomyces sp. NPDC002306]